MLIRKWLEAAMIRIAHETAEWEGRGADICRAAHSVLDALPPDIPICVDDRDLGAPVSAIIERAAYLTASEARRYRSWAWVAVMTESMFEDCDEYLR